MEAKIKDNIIKITFVTFQEQFLHINTDKSQITWVKVIGLAFYTFQ